jgi:hypothetical protein
MNEMDLDIHNYTINDIINLFKITHTLSFDELKQAKKMVLKTHPDKSRLDSKYYIFFSTAYKMLLKIYEFKNKGESITNNANTEYNSDYSIENTSTNENNKQSLIQYFKKHDILKSDKSFNKWFNAQFEKGKISSHFEKSGYGDWLKSNDDFNIYDEASSISDIHKQIDLTKKQLRDMAITTTINDSCSSNIEYSSLSAGDDTVTNFSSDIFTNLPFQDLKQAHVETVIPVTNEDYDNVRKYNSVDEIKRDRIKDMNCKPMSTKESTSYFEKQTHDMDTESVANAFNLLQDYEKQKKQNNNFWSDIRTLKY